MAKESYPYKIIVFLCSLFLAQSINHAHPGVSQAIVFILIHSQTFSLFTQYMSMSHGHSTMGGIEGGNRQKEGGSFTSTRQINGLWRCPSIDINVNE
jgi:hypothetical protein